jgi:hypothetical protein
VYAPFGAPFGTGRPRAARTGDRRDDGHTQAGSLNVSLRLPLRALAPAGPDFVDSVQVAQGPQPAALPVALVDCAPAPTQPEVRGSRKRRRSSVVLYTRPVVGSSQGVKLDDHDDMPRSRPKWAEWKRTDAQADGSFQGLTRSAGGVHSTPLPVGLLLLLRRLEKLCVTSGPPSTWQVHIRTAGLRLRPWTPSKRPGGPSSLKLRGQKPTQTQGTPTRTWSPSLTLAPA